MPPRWGLLFSGGRAVRNYEMAGTVNAFVAASITA